MRRSLMLTLMTWSVLSVPGLALAAEGGTGGWVGPFAVIAALPETVEGSRFVIREDAGAGYDFRQLGMCQGHLNNVDAK